MKIATNLGQSKKLAEFLPIESADMHYSSWTILADGEYILSPNNGETIKEMQEEYGGQIIPAWSASALMDMLPVTLEYKDMSIRLRMDKGHIGNTQYAMWYDDLATGLSTTIEAEADNFVDTCVEMILKLKEKELI